MTAFVPARPKGVAAPKPTDDVPRAEIEGPRAPAVTNGRKPPPKPPKTEAPAARSGRLGELQVLEAISLLLSTHVASKKSRKRLLEIAARLLG